jgi:hypothetical protein
LFPAGTLAYAELRDPATVADTLAAMVKGTSLEDGLKLLHDRRDSNKEPRLFHGQPGLSLTTTITSPEFLAEFRKLHGAAVGLTGFTKDHEPKVAAVVLLGDASAAALLVRAYLANEATFRRVDTLDGVPVFQSRAAPVVTFDQNTGKQIVPEPAKATEGPLEPTFAFAPGLFVVGSNKEAVADVLARHRKAATDSLAAAATFCEVTRMPGVNFFVRLPAFVKAADAAKKAKKDVIDPARLAFLRLAVNPNAVPTVFGHFSLRPDGIGLTVEASRDPKFDSPLVDLLDGRVAEMAPRTWPTDVATAVTLGLPSRPKRAATVTRFADALAKANGEVGKLPSDTLADIEQRTRLPIRENLLASVEGVSVLLPPKQELPAKVEPLPLVALHLESEQAATELLRVLPNLLSAPTGADTPASPTSETVNGTKVLSVRPTNCTVHYAQAESTLILGLDRKWVAACGTATRGKNLSALRAAGPDAAFAVGVPLGLAMYDRWPVLFPSVGGNSPLSVIDGGLGFGPTQQQPLFTEKELTAAFGPMPPLVGRVTKTPERLTAEVRIDFGPAGAKPMIERLIPVIEKLGAGDFNPYGRGYLTDR